MLAIASMVERTKRRSRPRSWTRTSLSGRIRVAIWLLAAFTEASTGIEAPPRSEAAPQTALQVRFHEGLLSLEARHTPWKQVLTLIQQKSGIRFHPASSLTGSVSASVPALPVMQALERLFGPKTGFICRYPAGTVGRGAVPREVWILGQVRSGKTVSPTEHKLGVLPAPQNLASLLPGSATEDDATASVNQEADVIQHLTRMAQDEDPWTRMQALSALAQSDKGEAAEIEGALEAALDDEDPNVRGVALQTLASRGGPEATGQLRQALQDPDPGVRILAVESVAPGQAGRGLLEEALSDPNETVRAMAHERLEEEADRTNEGS